MAGPVRPSLDVTGTLERPEWLELHRAALRRTAFWPATAAVAGLTPPAAGAATALGAPVPWTLAAAVAVWGALAGFGAGTAWLGPRLRFPKVPATERTVRWRISGERLLTESGDGTAELAWRDVDRVRITRRLVTFELTDGRGVLALPRRTATDLGETLILGWAGEVGRAPDTVRGGRSGTQPCAGDQQSVEYGG